MFDFKLQPVLNFRKQSEEKLMLEFAETKRSVDCEKETLEKLRKEKADLISRLKKEEGNRTRAAEILDVSVRTIRNKLNGYKKEAEAQC